MTSPFLPAEQSSPARGDRLPTRRSILRVGGAGALTLGSAPLLAACGSSKSTAGSASGSTGNSTSGSSSGGSASSAGSTSAAPSATASSAAGSSAPGTSKSLGVASVQLSWIKNIEFAGEFFADQKGYYRSAGFSGANLIAGGSAGSSAEAAVASGKALIGLSSPNGTAPAILKGAKLKTIGTTYQKNPFCIVSVARNPIANPQAMKGKKIGIQPGVNNTIFLGLLKANGLTTSDVKIVPVQYDPTIVTTGQVDGFMAYITNEPILLRGKGFKTTAFLFADYGLPFLAETFIATDDSIAKDRDKLKAFLLAEIKGWTDAVASPSQSATYAVTMYGKDQKLEQKDQVLEATAQNALIVTPESIKNGFGTISDTAVASNIKSLAAIGISITGQQLFDLSLIEEVYQENPGLVAAFAKAAAKAKSA